MNEQIDAGRKFIDEFDKHIPVRAAFWLKVNEDSGWYLYVASDQITDENIDVVYGEVAKVFRMIDDPNLDVFQIKLIGTDDPFARAALGLCERSKAATYQFTFVGGHSEVWVLRAYVYPPPVAAVSK